VESAEGLRVIQSIFPDQLSVPCVPTIFRASNPPPEVDVGAHKSDPPIPGSTAIEGQNVFRWPPIIKEVDAPEVEEDSLTSSDESSAGLPLLLMLQERIWTEGLRVVWIL